MGKRPLHHCVGQVMEDPMRLPLLALAVVAMTGTAAHAGSQSSNTSSNSSSNNGVVRERTVDTYCENSYCERYLERRVYRDDRGQRSHRGYDRRRDWYYRHYRQEGDDD